MPSGVNCRLVGTGLCAGLIAGAACHVPPREPPVPLEGTRADLSALAGTWAGQYWSEVTGRQGRVTFRLRSGADTAYGEVEMTFSRALRLYGDDEEVDSALRREPFTAIDIAVVRIEGRMVRGTLAPYRDPDCDCRTRTVFEGELVQDHIAGAFTSRREAAAAVEVTGLWFADREPK